MSDSIKVAIKPLIERDKNENLSMQWVTEGNTIAPTDVELRKQADGEFKFGMTLICYEINTVLMELRLWHTKKFNG